MNNNLNNDEWGWNPENENNSNSPESFSWGDEPSSNSTDQDNDSLEWGAPQFEGVDKVDSNEEGKVDGLIKGVSEQGEEWTAAVYTNPDYTVHGLFPTPIATLDIPKVILSKQYPFLQNQKYLNEENSTTDTSYGGEISENKYLLNSPDLLALKDFITTQVNWFSSDVLKLPDSDFKITQSWITKKGNSQSHVPHMHSNSVISGALFLGDLVNPPQGLPPLEFHRPQQSTLAGNQYLLMPGLPQEDDVNEFSAPSFFVNFVPGTLVLFPSSLMHSVKANNTNIARYTLSFNAVPKDGIGEEMNLNRLSFN